MAPAPTFMEKSFGFWAAVALADVALFMLWIMPWGAGRLAEYSGGEVLFDTLFQYSPALFYEMAQAYTEEGRRFYLGFLLIADSLFPLAYGLFFFFLLTWLAYQAWPEKLLYRRVWILPLATVLADFLENALLITLVIRFPEEHQQLVQIASTTTSLKWVLVATMVIFCLVFAAMAIMRRLFASIKP